MQREHVEKYGEEPQDPLAEYPYHWFPTKERYDNARKPINMDVLFGEHHKYVEVVDSFHLLKKSTQNRILRKREHRQRLAHFEKIRNRSQTSV